MSEYTPTTGERDKLIHLLFDQVPEDWDENDIGIMADALEESAWLSTVIATAKAEGVDAASEELVRRDQFSERTLRILDELATTIRAGVPVEHHEEDTITIPRPHVLHGPEGLPEHTADADYLMEAARHIEGGYPVGGSNLTATVIRLLRDVAAAIRAAEGGRKSGNAVERCQSCADGLGHSARCHYDEHEVCDRLAENSESAPCECRCHQPESAGSDAQR